MKYIKILFSTMLAMLIATAIIWFSLFAIIFSAVSLPVATWWKSIFIKRGRFAANKNAPSNNNTPYKVIEAEYKIVNNLKR